MILVIQSCPKEMTIFVVCTRNDVCDQKGCTDKLCEHHPARHPVKTKKKKH